MTSHQLKLFMQILETIDQETITRTCLGCGATFDATGVRIGKTFIASDRCKTCGREHDALLARNRAEEERRKRETKWASKCPWEFRLPTEDGGPDSIPGPTDLKRMEAASPNWRRVLEWKTGPVGLLLVGVTGTCKTRAMWRLLRKLFDEGVWFKALTAGALERGYRDAMSAGDLESWFDCLVRVPVLFLDDLGKLAATECIQSSLFALIDERTSQGRPLLITMNDSSRTLKARLSEDRGAPLVRRLQDYCRVLVFDEPKP